MRLLQESSQWAEGSNGYPPYNIERTGDDEYRITLAVAGFGEPDLSVVVHENVLMIEGQKKEVDKEVAYLYRGIGARSFKRQFQLADHVELVGAHLRDGLLVLDLVRRVPEQMKPRKIEIATSEPASIGVTDGEPSEEGQEAA
jgi:molecular chaperone IbpA